MPKKVERCVKKVKKQKGKSKSDAWGICYARYNKNKKKKSK